MRFEMHREFLLSANLLNPQARFRHSGAAGFFNFPTAPSRNRDPNNLEILL